MVPNGNSSIFNTYTKVSATLKDCGKPGMLCRTQSGGKRAGTFSSQLPRRLTSFKEDKETRAWFSLHQLPSLSSSNTVSERTFYFALPAIGIYFSVFPFSHYCSAFKLFFPQENTRLYTSSLNFHFSENESYSVFTVIHGGVSI